MRKRAVLEPGTPRALAVEKRLAQMPASSRGTYRRAAAGRSVAAAVKAFCGECVGWQRAEVTACKAVACPLWPYRPYQSGAAAEILQNAQDGAFQPPGRDGVASAEVGAGEEAEGPVGEVEQEVRS